MPNEDGSVQLVFNGEIYNFQALREELEAKGHRFRSRTDTEVIVHLYEEEGERCLTRLNGMFALALWDARRRTLLLARDPLGIKPLYYSQTARGLVFASELKALLVHPEVGRDIDPLTIHQHLSYIWAPAPQTMLRNVQKLEPGFFLLATEGTVVKHRPFYDLPFDGLRIDGSVGELAERVHDALAVAVRRQMISDVPVGAFLSGGMDSSSVVALMRRARAERFPCYTIALDRGITDENPNDLPFARLVAAHLGLELREVSVSADVVGFTERMVYLLDEPQADPACINVYLIAEQARKDGCKVLLSGAGGDDLFSGYRRHTGLYLERFWSWIPHSVRASTASAVSLLGDKITRLRRIRKYLVHAGLDPEDRLLAYFLWSADAVVRPLFAPGLAAELTGTDVLSPLRRSLDRIPSEPDALNRMLYLEAKHFLADHNLNYTDKMSMAQGIEVRVPFLDLDLVDLAVRLPPQVKMQGMHAKALLKRAMQPLLPAEILNRPKTGFGAPLRHWLRHELREMVHDVLSPQSLKQRGIFDAAAVQRLVTANERRSIDGSYLIFSIMCIEMWMRTFVDSRVAVPAAEPLSIS